MVHEARIFQILLLTVFFLPKFFPEMLVGKKLATCTPYQQADRVARESHTQTKTRSKANSYTPLP